MTRHHGHGQWLHNQCQQRNYGLRRYTILTPKQMSATERRLTPFYNSDPPLNPLLGGDFGRAIYRAPCGAWQARLASRGGALAGCLPLRGATQLRRGSLFTHICHSEGGLCPTVGVSRSEAPFVCPIHPSTKREILTSRFSIAPQNDRPSQFDIPQPDSSLRYTPLRMTLLIWK